jgi:hypothetical protein
MDAKPKRRRWYQFSLRTLLIVFTLTCVGFAWWVHWSKEWIRQRHEALATLPIEIIDLGNGDHVHAPGGLWIFGEAGVDAVRWFAEDQARMEKIKQLFPEAVIMSSSTGILTQGLYEEFISSDVEPAE